MQARRPQLAELGLFLLVVALPLVFTPFSASPFGDAKLVVLVAACACLLGAGLPVDRLTAFAGGALLIAAVLAALVGVDVPSGLTAQTTSAGTGVITIACVAVVAAIGAALPDDVRGRAIRWFIGAAIVVAAIGVAFRFAPNAFESLFPGKSMEGATLGNPVFAIAFVAGALGALLASEPAASARTWWASLAMLSLGASSFGQRGSIVFVILAGAVAIWRRSDARRRLARGAAAALILVLVWQVISPFLPEPTRVGADLSSLTSDRARLVAWSVGVRGSIDRPVLGWGPGSSRSALMANASSEDLEIAGRSFSDVHNLFVGALVEMGIVGLAAMIALAGLVIRRAMPGSTARAASFTAAAVLFGSSLVEPVNLVMTPLLFFLLALAGPISRDTIGGSSAVGTRVGRGVAIVALVVALVVSLQMATASTFERWGRTYGETWALQRALDVQPWRLSAAERLALLWALDGRAGDEQAGERARDVIGEAVDDHPWDADVRLWAADVETLLRNEAASRSWVDEHLERFPGDAKSIEEAAAIGPANLPG